MTLATNQSSLLGLKHVNKRGTVYTIRFAESSAILDHTDLGKFVQDKNTIYKPKSRYHVHRDSYRMKDLNNSHSYSHPVETKTYCDISNMSEKHHSKPVSHVNNQQLSHASDSKSLSTHSSVLHSDAFSHVVVVLIMH